MRESSESFSVLNQERILKNRTLQLGPRVRGEDGRRPSSSMSFPRMWESTLPSFPRMRESSESFDGLNQETILRNRTLQLGPRVRGEDGRGPSVGDRHPFTTVRASRTPSFPLTWESTNPSFPRTRKSSKSFGGLNQETTLKNRILQLGPRVRGEDGRRPSYVIRRAGNQ